MTAKRILSILSIITLTLIGSLTSSAANANSQTQLTPNLVVSQPFTQYSNRDWDRWLMETGDATSVVYKGKLYFEIYNYTNSKREMARLNSNGQVETMTDKGIPIRPIGPAIVFNGYLYFSGYDENLSYSYLYRFDGQTTVKVSNYRTVGGLDHMAVLDGELYMVAFDQEVLELGIYKLVGNDSVIRVVDFDAGGPIRFAHYLVPFNGYLYFIAGVEDVGAKYFKFDGNEITQAFDLNPGEMDVSTVGIIEPVVYQDKLYFSAIGKTGASQTSAMLYSLDKSGNIRSYLGTLRTDRTFATFKLQVLGKYLYGLYGNEATFAGALFRFDGKKIESIQGISQNMDGAALVQVDGNIYAVGDLGNQKGEILVIDGLRAKKLTPTPTGLSEIWHATTLLGIGNSLVYSGKDTNSTYVTVRQVLNPRLWVGTAKSSLTAVQLKQAKAFLKTNRTYKKLSCTGVNATSAISLKRAKAFCKAIAAGTKFKTQASAETGVVADFGVTLVLTK